MIAILSPAKRIVPQNTELATLSSPRFLDRAKQLSDAFSTLSPFELERLMRINPSIALDAFCAYQDFSTDATGTAALFSFQGLCYQYLKAETFSQEDLLFAQEHLRILSAFYGLLRPLDGILPYRLEFQCQMKIEGKSLYAYWGDAISRALCAQTKTIFNLASEEYAAVIRRHLPCDVRFVECTFLCRRGRKSTVLPANAKMARGALARYIVQHKWDRPEDCTAFSDCGFCYCPALSDSSHLVFERCLA